MNAPTQSALFDRYGLPAEHAEPTPEFRNRAPVAGNADPVSSHIAGAAVTESGSRNNQKAALLRWLRGVREPLTSAEIAAAGGFDRHGTARRLPDLERDGHVERWGERTCRQTGAEQCITWRAIDGMGTRVPHRQAHHQQCQEHGDTTGSTPAGQLATAPATCIRCKDAGVRRISTEPTIWAFCDETSGKACIAAERRRRINGDPNHELSPSELEGPKN